MAEAVNPDPFSYATYNDFFTRALKSHVRPIASGLYDFVSPADGTVIAAGKLNNGQLLQAKGQFFNVRDLLGGTDSLGKYFSEGQFLTVYLAPHNYHRVHMPIDGQLIQMIVIPGRLFSVNAKSTATVPRLFARNERVVCIFNTSIGRVAIILIGAMIVGSIETVWAGTLTPNSNSELQDFSFDNGISLRRGEELGRFKLGSTVIVLTKPNLAFNPEFEIGTKVVYGQKLAEFKPDQW